MALRSLKALKSVGFDKPRSAVKRVKFRRLAVYDYSFTLQEHRGDKMVSMDLGPVLSQIYDATKPKNVDHHSWWYDYISERQNTTLYLADENAKTDELSKFEMKILREVYNAYGHMKPIELSRLTHKLPEFKDPKGGSIPIDPVEILRHAGKTEEEIQEFSQLSDEVAFLKSLP